MTQESTRRPAIVIALSILFLFGTIASFVSAVSLIFPDSFLEPLWRLNPRAHQAFGGMGVWAIVLMCVVSVSCLSGAIGLWRGRRWGFALAIILLTINLLGSIVNVATGTEPRAAVGIPIVILVLVFLTRRSVRRFFGNH